MQQNEINLAKHKQLQYIHGTVLSTKLNWRGLNQTRGVVRWAGYHDNKNDQILTSVASVKCQSSMIDTN